MPYYANKNEIPDGMSIPSGSSQASILDAFNTQRKAQNPIQPTQPGQTAPAGGGGFVQGQPGINFETGNPISTNPTTGIQQSFFGSSPGGATSTFGKGPTDYSPGAAPVANPIASAYTSTDPYHLGPSPGSRVLSVTPLGGAGVAGGASAPTDNGKYLESILAAVQGNYDKANAANEARYAQAGKTLDSYGKSYSNQIAEQGKVDLGKAESDAVSRGLGNTTVRQGLLNQANRTKNDANLNLQDRLAAQKVSLLQSKYDNAPDPSSIASLLAQATGGAYGSGNSLASIAKVLGLKR